MCGIVGLLDPDGGSRALRDRAEAMAAQLRHRGPDAQGVWAEEGVALGHARLSILDLSEAGAQPMHSCTGRFVIAFNGEIYNHLDLRAELESDQAAPQWRGHSDTETLLAAIEHWGLDESLRRSRGMFALALWDRKNTSLALARDRIGEKPLYWGHAGNRFVFGSELKAVRIAPDFDPTLSPKAVREYLRFGYVPAPFSIYASLWKLEPGAILEIEGHAIGPAFETPPRIGMHRAGMSIRRYWSIADVVERGAEDPVENEAEAVDGLERVLGDAVERQMIADVPLGAFLSGGVDSSAITALMQQRSKRRVQTFTIGFDAAEFDESPHAAAVAEHLATDHHCEVVTAQEARDVIPTLPQLYDEPFADYSQIPTFLLCRSARRQVTVALSGDGGDELFGGYNRYLHGPSLWRRFSRIPATLRGPLAQAILSVPVGALDRGGDIVARVKGGTGGVVQLGTKAHRFAARMGQSASVDDLHRAMASINPDPGALIEADAGPDPALPFDEPLPDAVADAPAARMMLRDMRSYLPDDILCKVDRAAMGVSLETRVPFLDPEVVAYAARLPMSLKIRNGVGKHALREVLYRHVPRHLIERPKAGFSPPLGQWLRGPLREWAEHLLDSERIESDGLLRAQPIRILWRDHLSGQADNSAQLWTILMLQAWREKEGAHS